MAALAIATAAISSRVHAETLSESECVERMDQIATHKTALVTRANEVRRLLHVTRDHLEQALETAVEIRVENAALEAYETELKLGRCAHMARRSSR